MIRGGTSRQNGNPSVIAKLALYPESADSSALSMRLIKMVDHPQTLCFAYTAVHANFATASPAFMASCRTILGHLESRFLTK